MTQDEQRQIKERADVVRKVIRAVDSNMRVQQSVVAQAYNYLDDLENRAIRK